MNIAFPDNIFSFLILQNLPDDVKDSIELVRSSEIALGLETGKYSAALLPSLDLINHHNFLISSKYAISFDGLLSNAFLYFTPNQVKFEDLFFIGDISKNEILLAKILFKERYSSEINIHLSEEYNPDRNYLIAGKANFEGSMFKNGLSFADELSTMLFLPYVNYIFAAKEDKHVSYLHRILEDIDEQIQDNMDTALNLYNLETPTKNFIEENINSVYFEMTDNEIDGLTELIRLPFYHGIVDEMVDIHYV